MSQIMFSLSNCIHRSVMAIMNNDTFKWNLKWYVIKISMLYHRLIFIFKDKIIHKGILCKQNGENHNHKLFSDSGGQKHDQLKIYIEILFMLKESMRMVQNW